MGNLKFHDFEIAEAGNDSVSINFKISNLKGVDTILKAFRSGKNMVEGKMVDGLMGFIGVAASIYSFIKAGKR